MNLLTKLPASRREPPGLEWRILKLLPLLLAAGTAIPAFSYLYAMAFPSPIPGESVEKYLTGVAITAIAVVITAWTAVLTVAIGCTIVWLMKGPAYVADAYPLVEAETPRTRHEDLP